MNEIVINGKTVLKSNHKVIAVDFETTGLEAKFDIVNYPVTYVSFCYQDESGHLRAFGTTDVPKGLTLINEIVEQGWCLIVHNSSFDLAILDQYGIVVPLFHDTMIMSYVWYPESSEYHSLATLAPLVNEVKYERPSDFKQVSNYLKKYGNQDALITYKLFWYFCQQFANDEKAYNFYINIELPYANTIREMELGCYVDIEAVKVFTERITRETSEMELEAVKMVGNWPGKLKTYKAKYLLDINNPFKYEKNETTCQIRLGKWTGEHCELNLFNLNSTEQVAQKLIEIYRWSPQEWTPAKKPKMSKDVLDKLDYPLVRLYQKYDKKKTLLSNFLKKIETQAKNGYIKGSFNQCQTRTGRLSSSSMKTQSGEYGLNLQNIPAKGEGAELRRMFIAPPGWKIVCGDLDRIEVVVLGFYLELFTGDNYFADLVRRNVDVHDVNTVNWRTKIPKENFISQYGDKEWDTVRKTVKNGLFCLVYGGGATKLAKTADIPLTLAQEIIQNIRNTTKIFQLKAAIEQQCVAGQGILHDWLGRRLVVPEILSAVNEQRATGVRRINNYIIQGTAGSVFKYLQLKLKSTLQTHYPQFLPQEHYRQILAIHDEAVYLVREEYADWFAQVATSVFHDNTILSTEYTYVPVTAQFHVADNWADAKK